MVDRYLRHIEQDGSFLAGYHQNQATGRENTYLAEHLRIVRILSGAGIWRMEDRLYEVKPGDILLFNNVTPRQIVQVSECPLVYELVGFSTRLFSFETYYIKLFYSSPRCPIINPAEGDARELHALFDMLKRQFHRELPSKPAIVGLLGALCAMLFEISSGETAAAKTALPSRSTCEIIKKAIRYIEQNLCELHDVSQVAEQLHMSRGHFHKLFTRYTGYTPKAFINRCRIVRFLYLATTRDMTVLDAAMQSGFESSSGFYKTFHSVCGMSPMQYLSQQEMNKSG